MSISSAPRGLPAPAGRETAVDVLRGWFIVSMTVAHVAAGSLAYQLTHVAVWLDGAIGFVACSGLVLGLVYRRVLARTGRLPYGKALRRARLLYGIQLAVLVLALAVASVSERFDDVQDPGPASGWLRSLWLAATLRLPADHLDVLPMYVLLLLAAVPSLWLLARGRARTLLAVAGAVYVVSLLLPALTTPPDGHFTWGAWQLPFVLGLVIGWSWQERGIAAALRSRTGVAVSASVAGTCFVLAQVFGRSGLAQGTAVDRVVGASFDKFQLGPAHIVFGFSAMALGYAVVSALLHVGPLRPLWQWLALLGSRSLDAFVIHCLAVVALPALLVYGSTGVTAMALAVLTLLAQTAWVVARRRGLLPGLATGTAVPDRPMPRLLRTA